VNSFQSTSFLGKVTATRSWILGQNTLNPRATYRYVAKEMVEQQMHKISWLENMKEREHLGDLGTDETIILISISKKQTVNRNKMA
jgi:hypothetical protein